MYDKCIYIMIYGMIQLKIRVGTQQHRLWTKVMQPHTTITKIVLLLPCDIIFDYQVTAYTPVMFVCSVYIYTFHAVPIVM